MEARKFAKYLKSIEPIEAHEQLLLITTTMFPNMKQRDRKNLYNKISIRLKNVIEETKKLASWDNFKVVMRG